MVCKGKESRSSNVQVLAASYKVESTFVQQCDVQHLKGRQLEGCRVSLTQSHARNR